jgi:hypothetical protein
MDAGGNMIKFKFSLGLALLFTLSFTLSPHRPSLAEVLPQNEGWTGGVLLYTIPPQRVCVGDTLTIEGGASVTAPDYPGGLPLAYLSVINLDFSASHGKVNPANINDSVDFKSFRITYTATSAGAEKVTAILNGGLAQDFLSFQVEEKCDYDAFLMTIMYLQTPLGDADFKSLSFITGMGTMKRDRGGSEFLQGVGKWNLEENVLTPPPDCVTWYIPPLIADGPFELDGHVADEGDILDVILTFKPSGKPIYHGVSTCTYEDGSQGEGWSFSRGKGDAALASKINASYPIDGGSQQVKLEGKGMEMVESQADVEYLATLTLIPR